MTAAAIRRVAIHVKRRLLTASARLYVFMFTNYGTYNYGINAADKQSFRQSLDKVHSALCTHWLLDYVGWIEHVVLLHKCLYSVGHVLLHLTIR